MLGNFEHERPFSKKKIYQKHTKNAEHLSTPSTQNNPHAREHTNTPEEAARSAAQNKETHYTYIIIIIYFFIFLFLFPAVLATVCTLSHHDVQKN